MRENGVVWATTGDRWWRNIEDRAPVAMRIAGGWHEAVGEAITNQSQSGREHDRLFRAHGWFRWLSGIPGDRRGGPDRAALDRALAAGRVLVRIELVS